MDEAAVAKTETWDRQGSGPGLDQAGARGRRDGRRTWNLTRVAAVGAIVLGLDQASKVIVRVSMPLCTTPHALGCERIRLAGSSGLLRGENPGGAFGLGMSEGSGVWMLVAILGLALVIAYARKRQLSPILGLGMALQLSGILGNLADRLVFGAVTDFIYLTRGLLFNIADLALAIGSILAFVALATSSHADSSSVKTKPGLSVSPGSTD